MVGGLEGFSSWDISGHIFNSFHHLNVSWWENLPTLRPSVNIQWDKKNERLFDRYCLSVVYLQMVGGLEGFSSWDISGHIFNSFHHLNVSWRENLPTLRPSVNEQWDKNNELFFDSYRWSHFLIFYHYLMCCDGKTFQPFNHL